MDFIMYKKPGLPSLCLLFTLGLTGCFSEPRLDTTSMEQLNASAFDMIQSLPEQEGKRLSTLIQQAMIITSDNTDKVLGEDLTSQSLTSMINQKTATEIMQLAPMIEQHMNQLQEKLRPRALSALKQSGNSQIKHLINEYNRQYEKRRIALLTQELKDGLSIEQYSFFDNDKARMVLSNTSSQTVGRLMLQMKESKRTFSFDVSDAPLLPGEGAKEYVRNISVDINRGAGVGLIGQHPTLVLLKAYTPDGVLIYDRDEELTQWMDHMETRLNKLGNEVERHVHQQIMAMLKKADSQ
jgi:truncated hemoglobin YjbI